jgi:hypothetical protein
MWQHHKIGKENIDSLELFNIFSFLIVIVVSLLNNNNNNNEVL